MPAVANSGSTVAQSTRSGYVTYQIWNYQIVGYTCTAYDEEGNCISWRPVYDWVYSGNGSTNALITINSISASSSDVFVNGNSVVTIGDYTSESWIASPPVPSDTSSTQYRNVSPGTSGSGTGSVTVGNSSSVYVNGKSVAVVGSIVTTHLGTTSQITSGSSNVFIGE